MSTTTTGIEWTDRTWSPVSGCDKISPGCTNCYALTMARRLKGMGTPGYQQDGDAKTSGPGFGVSVHAWSVNQPLKWRKPCMVFVNPMGDLFHADIDQAWIADIFAVMAAARRHTFQVLTKRHARMRTLLNDENFLASVRSRAIGKGLPAGDWQWPIPNVWLGVSVEDQKWADIRIPALLDTPASIRFLSCEPLLGPVDLSGPVDEFGGRRKLTYWLTGRPGWGPEETSPTGLITQGLVTGPHIDWIIVGGESGPGARLMDLAWASEIVEHGQHAGVATFVKQLGSRWGKHHKDIDQFPAELRVRQYPKGGAL